jgi:hypothetical protein
VVSLVHPVITEIDEANRVLCWLDQEIERRATGRYVIPKIFGSCKEQVQMW